MSPDLWRDRVRIMLEDIERIHRFIAEMDRDTFIANEQVVYAVCYAFVRLGEAVGYIPDEIREAHPEIEWRQIRQFRNFMIHVYEQVDPAHLYDTAKTDLPALEQKLQSLL